MLSKCYENYIYNYKPLKFNHIKMKNSSEASNIHYGFKLVALKELKSIIYTTANTANKYISFNRNVICIFNSKYHT